MARGDYIPPFFFIIDTHVMEKVAMLYLDYILLDQDIKVLWINLIFIIRV